MEGLLAASQIASASRASVFYMSAALAVRGDKLGRNQAHVMSESAEFACPVVRGAAGIHCNETRFKFRKTDNESIARNRSKLPQG